MTATGPGHRVDLVLRAFPGQGAAKLVLVGIAYHDGEGGSWPSLDTLATYASVDRRHVRRVVRDLETDGWITTKANEGGTLNTRADRRSNLYLVDYGRLQAVIDGRAHVSPRADDGGTSTREREDMGARHGGTSTPPEQEPEQEPQLDLESAGMPSGLPAVTKASGLLPEAMVLCDLLAGHLTARGYRATVTTRWVIDMEQMMRLDERTPQDVGRVLRWLDAGRDDVSAFWRTNVRSPATLRAKWTVMAEQWARANRAKQPRTGAQTLVDRLADTFPAGQPATRPGVAVDADVRQGADH